MGVIAEMIRQMHAAGLEMDRIIAAVEHVELAQPQHSRRIAKKAADGSAETSKVVRGSRLPDDWVLSKRLGVMAMEAGLSEAETRLEALKFADYWHSQPGQRGVKIDWDGTWRNWCREALRRRPVPRSGFGGPATMPVPRNVPADEWAKRMKVFRKMGANGGWSPSWGPMPGEAGCMVPAELIEQEKA